jgi:YD repeat-containing protein
LLTVKDGRASGSSFDISNTYDARYRLTEAANGAGETTFYHYDAANNVVKMIEPRGAAFTTKYKYGEFNELLLVDETERGGGTTFYVYDANRNKIAQQDANKNLVTFQYDNLNRLTDIYQRTTAGDLVAGKSRGGEVRGLSISMGGAGDVHWHFGYDKSGNQNLVIDPLLQKIDRAYDYLNRLEISTYSNFFPDPRVDPDGNCR